MTEDPKESRPPEVEHYLQNPEEFLEDIRLYLMRPKGGPGLVDRPGCVFQSTS